MNKCLLQYIKYLLPLLSLFTLAFALPVSASATHNTITVPADITPLSLYPTLPSRTTPPSTPVPGSGSTTSTGAAPTAPAGSDPSSGFDQAKGAVVRLLIGYTDTAHPAQVLNCTGLGVLVKSSGGTNWILTDSFLFQKNQIPCLNNQNATLSQVQIYFNASTNKKGQSVTLDSHSTPSLSSAIKCSDPKNKLVDCNENTNLTNGAALVSFQQTGLSSISLASAQELSDQAIALTKDGQLPPPPVQASSDASTYLTPQTFDMTDPNLEFGTPLIDNNTGHLTDLHLAEGAKLSDPPVNTLSSLIALITPAANSSSKTSGSTNSSALPAGSIQIPGTNLFIELWQLTILVLVLLFSLVSLTIRPRIQFHQVARAAIGQVNRRVAIVAQKTEATASAQRAYIEHLQVPRQSPALIQEQALQDKNVVHKLIDDLPCPRCGELVGHNANYCPNCRFALSPLEPEPILHFRIPSSTSSTTSKTQLEFDTVDIRADINERQLMEQEGGSQQ